RSSTPTYRRRLRKSASPSASARWRAWPRSNARSAASARRSSELPHSSEPRTRRAPRQPPPATRRAASCASSRHVPLVGGPVEDLVVGGVDELGNEALALADVGGDLPACRQDQDPDRALGQRVAGDGT